MGIKSFRGVKVAFIGMTLKATPTIVTPAGVAGLEFRDEADTVNALVPKLRRRGVEAIVVLVHQGGFQSSGLSDINGCDGNLAGSDLAKITARLDDAVDLVISGHTHAAYNCSAGTVDVTSAAGVVTRTPRPTGLPNATGRLIPVTSASAFGRVLTDIDVTLDRRTRDITTVAATNRLVDRSDADINAAIDADPALRNLVAGVQRPGLADRQRRHRLGHVHAGAQRRRGRQHAGRRADRRLATRRYRDGELRRRHHRLHEPRRRARGLHLRRQRGG